MRFAWRAVSSLALWFLLPSLFPSFAVAQNLPALTDDAAEKGPTTNLVNTKAVSKPTAKAETNTVKTNDAKPTALPAITSDSGPTGLPTRKGVKAPIPTVPPTAGAPYMQKSTLPEGTVFICVGAGLAFIGLVVLAWRGLVAWSLHRSVRKAAMAPSVQYSQLGDAKSKSKAPGTPFYSQGPGSTLSLDHLTAKSKGGSRSNTARSSLFFSPTAGSGMQTPGNRGSGYLPAGYYAAGNAAPGGGPGMAHVDGKSPLSGLRDQNHRYSRARSTGPSPPGTPSLPPSRGAEVGYRPSTAGLSTQASTSTLSTVPQGRAPSAYLEDLFEDHSVAGHTSHGHPRGHRN
ncbi:MAG: hypothetical protein Q9166_003229 [cf. Caloplaca sp. 2 TL-2023]